MSPFTVVLVGYGIFGLLLMLGLRYHRVYLFPMHFHYVAEYASSGCTNPIRTCRNSHLGGTPMTLWVWFLGITCWPVLIGWKVLVEIGSLAHFVGTRKL
jgi:hypothetical protein